MPSSPRSWRAAARAGSRRASARTSASPRRRCGSSAPRTRSAATWCPAIAGEKIAALAITEPGTGSDVAAIATRAERVDGGFVVNGEKTYITNGVRAGFYVTAVKTTAEGGHHGLSFLIVDAGEGVSRAKLDKLGWHASDTATVAFQDTFVPDENLLGEEHEGFRLIMANFQWERLLMALGAVGAMHVGTRAHDRLHARAPGIRPPAHRPPGGPPPARRAGHHRAHLPLRDLRRPAPLRRRRGRRAGGDDGQARHPARGLRRHRRLPAAARRGGLHARVRDRARRRATRGSGPSGAAPTR